jgi:GDP/UDP-N,N'-diacetylbacillosamine 2-epimerase (hydrolysing)
MPRPRRRITFVTGTRAEFGLMVSTLRAIQSHPKLQLQIVVTGMHLDRRRGKSIDDIDKEGWSVDQAIPWDRSDTPPRRASATGNATARLAGAFDRLKSDVILIVGDRVEAFAAAAAGHLSDRAVAHVHGGDRALGQADDSLRHAISKLAHVHFAATAESAARLIRMGEDRWRVHRVGAPGIDGIVAAAAAAAAKAFRFGPFALVSLHPIDADELVERRRAAAILAELRRVKIPHIVVIGPNNDPGSLGIVRAWIKARNIELHDNVPRTTFLGLLRDAAFLIGNSSAGIIEAASFGTPVIDIGPRQSGREHGGNVVHCSYATADIRRAIAAVWRNGRPKRFAARNPYGGRGAGRKIAETLASLQIDARLIRKLIAY